MISAQAPITRPIQIPSHLFIESPLQSGMKRRFRQLTITTVALVAIADWLFYKQPFGWSAGIFAFLLVSAIMLFKPAIVRTPGTPWLILAMIGLCIALAAQPGPLVITLAILCIVLLASLTQKGLTVEAWRWFFVWKTFFLFAFLQMIHDLRLRSRWQKSSHSAPSHSSVPHHFHQWFLPVTLSLGFLFLFAIANPLIDWFLQAFRRNVWVGIQTLDVSFSRFWLWCALATAIWALQRFPKRTRRPAPDTLTAPVPVRADFLVRCLGLFNAVFAAETLLDLVYLWGGGVLPGQMTYAEYAHRGAYPLIATALLAGLFVLITFRPGISSGIFLPARRLVYLWLAQNVFLTLSSMWRLHLYIEVYGLTRWRIAALIWMSLVAAGLLWIGCRVLTGRSNGWLVSMNLITTLFVLYGCCFVNFDGMIAWHNARHSRKLGVPADFEYLRSLGPESIPALNWLGNSLQSASAAEENRKCSYELEEKLRQQTRNWRGWTWRRHELLKLADHSF